MRKYLLLLSFSLVTAFALAQRPGALLQADTNRIRIGEQVKLTLSVFYNQKTDGVPKLVAIPDSLLEGKVLVAERLPMDTISMGHDNPNGRNQRLKFTVTSFDSANYTVGPFAFTLKGDTIFSNSIDFECITFEVDTTKAIKDIKNISDVPYGFWDWIKDHKGLLLFIGAALLVAGLIIYYLKKQKKNIKYIAPEPVDTRTPDEKAMERLEQIRKDKYWQRVVAKVYYTELTEIIKAYVEGRFEISTFEQTTGELLRSMSFTSCSADDRSKLMEILSFADLVKFARQEPNENDALQSLDMAIRFVENTKKPKEETTTENVEKL